MGESLLSLGVVSIRILKTFNPRNAFAILIETWFIMVAASISC